MSAVHRLYLVRFGCCRLQFGWGSTPFGPICSYAYSQCAFHRPSVTLSQKQTIVIPITGPFAQYARHTWRADAAAVGVRACVSSHTFQFQLTSIFSNQTTKKIKMAKLIGDECGLKCIFRCHLERYSLLRSISGVCEWRVFCSLCRCYCHSMAFYVQNTGCWRFCRGRTTRPKEM